MIDSDPSVTEDGELPEITPGADAEIDAEVERLQQPRDPEPDLRPRHHEPELPGEGDNTVP
ncbi:hypothetical protein thsps21_14710 [Pseudomonas sp. No.21]|jgi:hypothetical protein|uniref:hypothetical protein n=1 Tax=Pseudomonas tohonis TaxID=2725477 RepID=UPI001F183FE9|nr:hypothetical protein [Pseudomonas tohonis]GJN44727.1 hypothetical protein TUM20249_07130 [Pseudomonas tohonis]